MTLYTNANGREPFRAYTRDVLTKLTHALLELFTQGHRARTTIKSAYLHKVMLMLCDLDDTRVGEYVTDELVPDILDLAGKLATAKDYDEDLWVNDIQSLACALKAQVTRVQCKPGTTYVMIRHLDSHAGFITLMKHCVALEPLYVALRVLIS